MTKETMYTVTWTRTDGTGGGSALADRASADMLRGALYANGWKAVWVAPAEAPTGRHAASPPPVDEPLIGEVAKRVAARLRRSARLHPPGG